MAEQQVIVRSVGEYFDYFVKDGLKDNKPKETIREELIAAFREEMFGLMKFRLKVDDLQKAPNTEGNHRKVENTAKQTFKKWCALCTICGHYRETRGMIAPDDLKWEEQDRDASEEADYNEDDVGDDDLPIPDEMDD